MLVWAVFPTLALAVVARAATITGEVLDSRSGQPVPARLYVQGDNGRWFFAECWAAGGSAVCYEKGNWPKTNSIEYHVTLSAHPFRVELPPGGYTFTVERGTECRPLVQRVKVDGKTPHLRLPLQRWINMAEQGWFSGDTHVHRPLGDLPNLLLAEDLNIAFPFTYWVTEAFVSPAQGGSRSDAGAPAEVIRVDATHLIWPRNTEWEIFTVKGKQHHLGAVFALGHKSPFTLGAPPVKPLLEQTRTEGALLDLDKHDWPWSTAIVPLMNVDLFELANNHLWRTEFGMSQWDGAADDFIGRPGTGWSGNEREWIEVGCRHYYALLNCGFRLRPSAGTANGVHPVPLGFGRVYVKCSRGLSFEDWWQGLDAGRSFVTTGPMLLAEADGRQYGTKVAMKPGESRHIDIAGKVVSDQPINALEVIVNGEVEHRWLPALQRNRDGAHEGKFSHVVEVDGSCWIALRCWEPRPGGRLRFAHTAPWFFDVVGAPLRPRREEVDLLLGPVRREIARSAGVIGAEALAEYEQAVKIYEDIARQAR